MSVKDKSQAFMPTGTSSSMVRIHFVPFNTLSSLQYGTKQFSFMAIPRLQVNGMNSLLLCRKKTNEKAGPDYMKEARDEWRKPKTQEEYESAVKKFNEFPPTKSYYENTFPVPGIDVERIPTGGLPVVLGVPNMATSLNPSEVLLNLYH